VREHFEQVLPAAPPAFVAVLLDGPVKSFENLKRLALADRQPLLVAYPLKAASSL
jgi:hypothetical protein